MRGSRTVDDAEPAAVIAGEPASSQDPAVGAADGTSFAVAFGICETLRAPAGGVWSIPGKTPEALLDDGERGVDEWGADDFDFARVDPLDRSDTLCVCVGSRSLGASALRALCL